MASSVPTLRPLSGWKLLLLQSRQRRTCLRCLSTASTAATRTPSLPFPSSTSLRSPFRILNSTRHNSPKKLKTYPPPPSTGLRFPHPVASFNSAHLSVLDPTGSRTRLFDRSNPDVPRPGDILLVTFKTGEPFAGVCLSIRRRAQDTAVLLRNRLLMTGVEMWVKVYSPNVSAIEVVKRAERRARRARLYYLRKPKHDRGSVENEVEAYLKRRRLIRSGALGVKDPSKSAKRPEQARSGVGAR